MTATDTASGTIRSLDGAATAEDIEHVAALHDAEDVRFIPVGRSAVIEKLRTLDYWPAYDAAAIDDAIHYMGRLRQQDSAVKLDELMEDYQLFNPDNDMTDTQALTPEERAARRGRFLDGVGQLVFRANFEAITRAELERVLSETSPYGVDVDVDLDEFEPLLPFYRGVGMRERSKRDWKSGYLKMRHFRVPTYERLFLALTLKPAEQRVAEIMARDGLTREAAERRFRKQRRAMPDWVKSDHVYLKMFKDIPQIDIDMLLPNSGVKFRQLDRLILWLSGGGSTVYALVAAVLKLVLAVAISPVVMLVALFGFGGTAFRQVMSVVNTRTRYMAELVQKLYFHNISNNQGTLTLLIDEAEEEDIKEDALLYAFLMRKAPEKIDLEQVKGEIELFLRSEFGVNAAFDHEEAFGRLACRGLVHREGGIIRVLAPGRAVTRLRRLWIESLDLRPGKATLLDSAAPR